MLRRSSIHSSLPSRISAIDGEDGARALSRLDVGAGEHRRDDVWLGLMLQRHRDARPRFTGGATAHRIDDDHHGRALLIAGLAELPSEHGVDGGGGTKFANAKAGELLAHGSDEEFGVCHNLNIIS